MVPTEVRIQEKDARPMDSQKTRCPSCHDVFYFVSLQFLLVSANVSETQRLAKSEANTGDGGRVTWPHLIDRRMGDVPDYHEQSMRCTTEFYHSTILSKS